MATTPPGWNMVRCHSRQGWDLGLFKAPKKSSGQRYAAYESVTQNSLMPRHGIGLSMSLQRLTSTVTTFVVANSTSCANIYATYNLDTLTFHGSLHIHTDEVYFQPTDQCEVPSFSELRILMADAPGLVPEMAPSSTSRRAKFRAWLISSLLSELFDAVFRSWSEWSACHLDD